jgi:two-component system response regulator AlgR
MNVLIADDEPLARARLVSMLEEIGNYQVIAEAGSGQEVLQQCHILRPDIVLLDIRMPGMDGLEAARELMKFEPPPAVIFTTAFNDYAVKAFDIHAVGYLLKPVHKERLAEALAGASTLNRMQLAAISDNEQGTGRSHVSVKVRGNIKLIPVEDIYYFQAEQKYVTVCHQGGEDLMDESLKQLEDEFGERFIRIHRNALVARQQLVGLEKQQGGKTCVVLKDIDHRLEVSRRILPDVRKLIREKGS